MRIQIDGQLTIRDMPIALQDVLQEALKLVNPSYQQAIRTNPRARYALSEYIKYYEQRKSGEFLAPRGILERIERYCKQQAIPYRLEDLRRTKTFSEPQRNPLFSLRDYQRGVSGEALTSEQGIVRLDTGFGKTIIGAEIIGTLCQRTLIIVPKLDLIAHWKRELTLVFPDLEVGLIQGKQFRLRDVTLATIQTLRNLEDFAWAKDFGLLLVDEAHSFTTKQSRDVLANIPAKFRYGLTATARRTDEQGAAIEFIFGSVLVDKKMDRAIPEVELIESSSHIWVQEYADMIEEQVTCEARNKLIADVIERERKLGKKVLVLTKRVAHYELLHSMVDPEGAFCFASSDAKQKRDELLQGLRDGSQEFSALFGTYALLGTGIDIPKLSVVILAGDLKSDVLAEQSIGRIQRLLDGKPNPKVVDIVDKTNPVLYKQARIRQAFYRERNWL